TRVDMDRFAERSHRLAHEATEAGRLAEEIVGVTVKSRKGESTVEADEAIRPQTTLETLAGLKAIGGPDATHTAGNAPGVNDGAGAIALGHPIGASGSRIVGALVHELRRRGGGLGVAAICSGGGQGDAIVVEVNGG